MAKNRQQIAITLKRFEHAELGPGLFRLVIPRPYFERTWGHEPDSLQVCPRKYVILLVSYPAFAPLPAERHGFPSYTDNVRIIIELTNSASGGRLDAGRFRLSLDSHGVNRLVPDGPPTGPVPIQKYKSIDGKGDAYSFKDAEENTVYARCTITSCQAWRTWKKDYILDYRFHNPANFVAVDEGVTRLVDKFKPSSVPSEKWMEYVC